MQSTAWAIVSHLLKSIADAVLRTRRDKIVKIDDNAEEGVKTQESGQELSRRHLGVVIENRLQLYF